MTEADIVNLSIQDLLDGSEEEVRDREALIGLTPEAHTRNKVKMVLSKKEAYRVSILKDVKTFTGMSHETLVLVAKSLTEIWYKKGDNIIVQEDIGDAFYVLEEGEVEVTRKTDVNDKYEHPKLLRHLYQNSYFGEIALLTSEPRSATITVVSDVAKCLSLTKSKFDQIINVIKKVKEEARRTIGRDIVAKLKVFKDLSPRDKEILLESMAPIIFMPGTYICRQGTFGNTFYIIIEGEVRVTLNQSGGHEKELSHMFSGDFFGEIALIDPLCKRTANVISVDTVTCMSLSRSDFDLLLKSVKQTLIEHQALQTGGIQRSDEHNESVSQLRDINRTRRRISSFDLVNNKSQIRCRNLLRRFSKFIEESLWCSLYSRLFREITLIDAKVVEYGELVDKIKNECPNRDVAVKSIAREVERIMYTDIVKRAPADFSLVFGVLKQRNSFKEKYCRDWPAYQYSEMVKKLTFLRIQPLRKIVEAEQRGTTAFVILRGAVRLFQSAPDKDKIIGGKKKLVYVEDLGPGDIFGDDALKGMFTRVYTAQALTIVDLAVIEEADYQGTQDNGSYKMSVEERYQFLCKVPLFKSLETYKLYRIANVLEQSDIPKGVVLLHAGKVSDKFSLLVHGRLDVVQSLENRQPITSIQRFEYFGESQLLNSRRISKKKRGMQVPLAQEEFHAVTVTRVDLLHIPPQHYHHIESDLFNLIRSAYRAKLSWRNSRASEIREERIRFRKYTKELIESQSRKLAKLEFEAKAAAAQSQGATATGASSSPRRGDTEHGVFNSTSPLPSIMSSGTGTSTTKEFDMEDIPVLLGDGYDPFLVFPTCRTDLEADRLNAKIASLRKPKQARIKERLSRGRAASGEGTSPTPSVSRSPSPSPERGSAFGYSGEGLVVPRAETLRDFGIASSAWIGSPNANAELLEIRRSREAYYLNQNSSDIADKMSSVRLEPIQQSYLLQSISSPEAQVSGNAATTDIMSPEAQRLSRHILSREDTRKARMSLHESPPHHLSASSSSPPPAMNMHSSWDGILHPNSRNQLEDDTFDANIYRQFKSFHDQLESDTHILTGRSRIPSAKSFSDALTPIEVLRYCQATSSSLDDTNATGKTPIKSSDIRRQQRYSS